MLLMSRPQKRSVSWQGETDPASLLPLKRLRLQEVSSWLPHTAHISSPASRPFPAGAQGRRPMQGHTSPRRPAPSSPLLQTPPAVRGPRDASPTAPAGTQAGSSYALPGQPALTPQQVREGS